MRNLFLDLKDVSNTLTTKELAFEELNREHKRVTIELKNVNKSYQKNNSEINDYKKIVFVVKTEIYGSKKFKSKEANELVDKLHFALENVKEGDL